MYAYVCICMHVARKHHILLHERLLRRGYQDRENCKLICLASRRHQSVQDGTHVPHAKVRKAFLKVTHSGGVNYAALNGALRRHLHLAGGSDILVSSVTQKNMFRLPYRHAWKSRARGGRVGGSFMLYALCM